MIHQTAYQSDPSATFSSWRASVSASTMVCAWSSFGRRTRSTTFLSQRSIADGVGDRRTEQRHDQADVARRERLAGPALGALHLSDHSVDVARPQVLEGDVVDDGQVAPTNAVGPLGRLIPGVAIEPGIDA
jgi:hypothetical protein